MYSKTLIQTAATDVVAYRASTNSNFSALPSYLKSSNSGFYVNDIPGISLELIDNVKKEKTFNNYVQDIHNSELLQVVQRFVDRQKKKLSSKELLSSVTFMQRHNDFRSPITGSSRFCGYAITPRESKSININVKSAGLQSSGNESFLLYLFDPTQQTAIASDTITCTGKTQTWTDLNWDLEFDKLDGGAGGTYLIGYFEDDLTGQLYAQSCDEGMAHAAMKVTKHYAGIASVRFTSSSLNSTSLPDMERLESSITCQTPGFNLRVNIKCDITDVIVDNITMFGEAVQYAIAIRYLRDAIADIGLNPIQSSAQNRESFEQSIIDLEGMLYGGMVEGVGYRRGIIDNLALDFSELDGACLKARSDRIAQVKW